MTSSILISVVSLILFLYWFRYTCLLILSAKPAKDHAKHVALANQLSFPGVREELSGAAATADLAKLEASLERDYRLLCYLLRQASEIPEGGFAAEDRILLIDYRIMKLWYGLSRPFASSQAFKAVQEMSEIVAYLANLIGERQTASAAAR